MVAYAYLRVSTDHQDLDNQRHGILEYANTHAISHLKFVEDQTSARLKWRSRMVGELILETAGAGDIIIFAEISRMARSTLQVLEILECCVQREISVHIAKQQMVLDDSMQSRITSTVLGLACRHRKRIYFPENYRSLSQKKSRGENTRKTARQSFKQTQAR